MAMKNIIISIIALILLCLPQYVEGQIASQLLNMSGRAAEIYERGTAQLYDPSNDLLGDTLIALSNNGRLRNCFIAGHILKSYAAVGQGKFAEVDSLLSVVIDNSFLPEYKSVFYLAYQFKANVRMMNNDYHGTLQTAQEMCRYAQIDHDPFGTFTSYYTMGVSFVMRDNPRLAHRYFSLAAKCVLDNNIEGKLWAVYFQLANCYDAMHDDDMSAKYAQMAIDAAKTTGNEAVIRRAEIGSLVISKTLYTPQEYISKYEEYAKTPDFTTLIVGDEFAMIRVIYLTYLGRMEQAIALADSMEVGVNSFNNKEFVYTYFEKWKDAYQARFQADMIHDSLQTVIQLEDFAALDSEMNNAELRNRAEKLQARNRQIVILSIAIVLFLVFLFVVLQYHHRQKQVKLQKEYLEAEVKRQVTELEQKSRIIEQKNRDITDSINYAQRIQSAILPDVNQYAQYDIEGAFTFFMPYNIVSGDFYWASRRGKKLMFACADCTGHGVPGAFMSMIGTTILNEITSSDIYIKPSEILEAMDKELIKTLNQNSTTGIQDGMDMSFIIYDCESHSLSFAAARRPVYLFLNGELNEVKGTKRSIGDRDKISSQIMFEDHEFVVNKGDTLYVCSDGIADQFGGQREYGSSGKRLRSSGLKKILEQIYPLDIEKQRGAIETLYLDWRGSCAQVDDVSLLGVRF